MGYASTTPVQDLERQNFDERTGKKTYRRVIDPTHNTIGAIATTITTSATLINLPEGSESVLLKHVSTGVTIWIGEDNTITAAGTNVFPVSPGDIISLRVNKGNNNNLYGIVASGTESIYALGAFNS